MRDGRAPVLSPGVVARSVSSWLVFSSLSSVLSFGTLWAGPGGATQAGASQSVAGAPCSGQGVVSVCMHGQWRTDARDSFQIDQFARGAPGERVLIL